MLPAQPKSNCPTRPANGALFGAQETLHLLRKAGRRLEPGVVADAGEDDDARVGQAGRIGVRVSGWDEAVLRSPEDQGGHLGPAEPAAELRTVRKLPRKTGGRHA